MTDTFRLSGRVEIDANQATSALNQTADGIETVTKAEKQKAASAALATAEMEKAASSAKRGAAAAKEAATAEAGLAKEKRDSAGATERQTQEELNLSRVRRAIESAARAQIKETNAELARQRAGVQQLGMQWGDTLQQLSLGVNPVMAIGQQMGQAAYAASMMGGNIGKVGTFLAGPYGSMILGAVTVTGLLVTQLWETDEAAAAAEKGMEEFARRQSDIGNFIDSTTGKLVEQNRTLVQNAILTRQASIEKNRAAIAEQRDAAFAAARRARIINATGEDQLGAERGGGAVRAGIDPAIQDAIRRAGNDAAKLDQYLQELGKRRPDLRATILEVSNAAGAAINLQRENERLAKEVSALEGNTGALSRSTASLVEKQVALATATTPLEKAQAQYNLVLARGVDATKAGGKALEQYRQDLTRAAQAVNAAEAAEKAAREATASRRREIRAAASEENALAEMRRRAAAEEAKLQEDFAADAAKVSVKVQQDALRGLGPEFEKSIAEGSERGWQAFEDRGAIAITSVGQALGGQLGEAAAQFGAILQGAASGNFTALGGRKGGLLSIAGGALGGSSRDLWKPQNYTVKRPDGTTFEATGLSKGNLALTGQGKVGDIFAANFQDKFKEPFKLLSNKLEGLFGAKGGTFAATAGKAFAGAAQGSIASGVAGALGIKQSQTGAQIGGAIGSMFGPLGGFVGGFIGGTLGGMLKSVKKGSATVSGGSDGVSVGDAVGNSAGYKKAASAMGNSVSDAVEAIVAQLGGDIGRFAVSIGQRDKKYVVDGSGQNRTKGAGVQKFKDESEAVQAALADAIRDGAVAGVSPRVQAVLKQYADNVNKAVAEALKVKSLEDLLANQKNPFATMFRDFDQMAKQRTDAARKYGFDVVEIEKINGEERAKLVKETLERSTASVKQLLDDLKYGSRSAGTSVDRRNALVAERDRLAGLARGGDQAALDKLASVSQQLLDLDREVFGTAGGNAASRAETVGVLEELVAATERRISEASKPQDAAAQKLDTTNSQLDEANDTLSVIAAKLDRLIGQGGAGSSATGANPAAKYTGGVGGLRGVGVSAR